MIERYSRPEVSKIWTDEYRFERWLEVEIAVCEAWAELGEIPAGSLATIKKKAKFDAKRVLEIEEEVRHDVIAFLTSVAEFVGPDSRFIHMGMTSSDLLDTSFALQLSAAGKVIRSDLEKLLSAVKSRAFEFKMTPMMGRSHGIHAEPITFGLKCAVWYAEFSRHLKRLDAAIDDISVGKISGAVGTFAHIPPEIESRVCNKLGLKPAPVSTQVIQRDRHAYYFSVLAGIAASIEKVALELRHLQRTEVFEAAESFGKKQKGSSAMPHKRNPILSENISGLARVVRANSIAALENVALWHERDISHSSAERVIAPDSTILVDFMLTRLEGVISGLDVFPERMKQNMDLSLGLWASQDVMLALIKKGMAREDAYRVVQAEAMRAWKEKMNFLELLNKCGEITDKLSKKELEAVFDLARHTAHVEEIFKRVFKSV
jgi:adenylosuccinate lyase